MNKPELLKSEFETQHYMDLFELRDINFQPLSKFLRNTKRKTIQRLHIGNQSICSSMDSASHNILKILASQKS